MGRCNPDPDDKVSIEDVEGGTTTDWFMHFDSVEIGTTCEYIYRVILGPEKAGITKYRDNYPASPPQLKPSGSCSGGIADLITVNADGWSTAVPVTRWVQVTDRIEKESPELSIPEVLSHHKSADAMPKPYREEMEKLRSSCT